MDRRTLLQALGIASVTPLLGWQAPALRRAVAVQPGENRFPYATAAQARLSPCKLTSEDSAGALSIFELNVAPRSGPVRHVHHREDEWCYVLSGAFIFELGGERHKLPAGGSIWMPRDIPHVWANTADRPGKLIVTCEPGGFERFFDELGKLPVNPPDLAKLQELMAKFGMEYLGPPLLGAWRQQR